MLSLFTHPRAIHMLFSELSQIHEQIIHTCFVNYIKLFIEKIQLNRFILYGSDIAACNNMKTQYADY